MIKFEDFQVTITIDETKKMAAFRLQDEFGVKELKFPVEHMGENERGKLQKRLDGWGFGLNRDQEMESGFYPTQEGDLVTNPFYDSDLGLLFVFEDLSKPIAQVNLVIERTKRIY